MNQQQNQQPNQQLYNAKAIKATVDFITEATKCSYPSSVAAFHDDVLGYLKNHFIVLQRLTTLGVKISQEPSEYEILLQYLNNLLDDSWKSYNVSSAIESDRIYNRDVLDRINASLKEAGKLIEQTIQGEQK